MIFRLLVLSICLSAGVAWSQEFPGGEVTVRPALVSDRGSHPTIVLQTVEGATTTATCLVLRYAEPGRETPPPGAAHLLEHLLYRTEPGGGSGELLLRYELLGNQSRAWVTPTLIVFSEQVPASEGLASLRLQLSRLKGLPDDPEGLRTESEIIKGELETVPPEETARREILRRLGYQPDQEGHSAALDRLGETELQSLLEGLELESDVAIAVVGPHSPREVRKLLADTLTPLAPARSGLRKQLPTPSIAGSAVKVESASGHDQRSFFYPGRPSDPRLPGVVDALAAVRQERVRVVREAADLFRLDVAPSRHDLSRLLSDLTQEESEAVFDRLQRSWLERHESPQARAEMLALATLRGEQPAGPVLQDEFPQLVKQARDFLHQVVTDSPVLTLTPSPGSTPRDGLFPYRIQANRGATRERLPNDLGVTVQELPGFPMVAVSGFFRISPPLAGDRPAELQDLLNGRSDLNLEYELQPDGLFFHGWASSHRLTELLVDAAQELKQVRAETLSTGPAPDPGPVESFFVEQEPDPGREVKGSRLINPDAGHLVVAGDIDEERLGAGLRPAWSSWFESRSPVGFSPSTPAFSKEEGPRGSVEISPSGSTPILLVGFSGPARRSPNFLAFNLALQTLAGRPTTSILARRLDQDVTSVKLFPLSSSITATESGEEQVWLIALRLAQNRTSPETLVSAVEENLKALGRRPLPESELQRTRRFLKSRLTLSGSTVRGRARVLAHAEFYRLSQSYADDYAGLYDHLTPEVVEKVVKPYLESPEIRWLYFRPE